MPNGKDEGSSDGENKSWKEQAYTDAGSPIARQFGKSAEERDLGGSAAELGVTVVNIFTNVAKIIELPTIWSYHKVRDWIEPHLQERLKDVAEERLQAPPPEIGGPIIEALRFEGQRPDLRELYVNLLATAMDRETAQKAHPGFTECLRQMTPDEARIMGRFDSLKGQPIVTLYERFDNGTKTIWLRRYSHIGRKAGCEFPEWETTSAYLDNLARLGLLEIIEDEHIVDESEYTPLEQDPEIRSRARIIDAQSKNETTRPAYFIERGFMRRTRFGAQFYDACVAKK